MDQLIYILAQQFSAWSIVYDCYFVTYNTTFYFVTLWQYLRNLLEDTKLFIRRNFENRTYKFLEKDTRFNKNYTKFRTFGHLRSS